MRTYISPIGYDTRRVTRPVVTHGLGPEDCVELLRPEVESDTERATQTIADVRQLLHEMEPNAELAVTRIPVDEFESAIIACSDILQSAEGELVLSLGGGARDILLPLLVSGLVHRDLVETVLFFSDLDATVEEWDIPNLLACPPAKTTSTLDELAATDGALTLSELAERTGHSKSTVVRHVQALESAGVVMTEKPGKQKVARISLGGILLSRSGVRS